jgi:uncharacterized protein (DUF1778 family)
MVATTRLDLRLSAKNRARIEHAAALAGIPLATFVSSAVLREAERLIAAKAGATLTQIEAKRFLVSFNKPFSPNAALRRALKRGDALGI